MSNPILNVVNAPISKEVSRENDSEKPAILKAKNCHYFCGVDISKDDFTVAHLQEDGKYQLGKFDNTDEGIETFIHSLKQAQETLVTLEATGTYSMKLVFALVEKGIPTAVLNPKQSKGFISGVLLSTTKTDNKDACGLALYGKINRPPIYELPSDKILEIRQLQNLQNMYKKRKAAAFNQLHALSFHARPSDFVVEALENDMEDLEEKIAVIDEKLCDLSKESFEKYYELTLSIKGIGPVTAAALLTVTNGCEGFQNVKQLAKFLGVTPTQKESGTSVKGHGSISKTGTKEIRTLLYMCAKSAKRYNLACKELYERLRGKGKCHKVAMVAVVHKLVKQYFAVVKSGVPFDNEYELKRTGKKTKNA